jgi:micrococcal nuclease
MEVRCSHSFMVLLAGCGVLLALMACQMPAPGAQPPDTLSPAAETPFPPSDSEETALPTSGPAVARLAPIAPPGSTATPSPTVTATTTTMTMPTGVTTTAALNATTAPPTEVAPPPDTATTAYINNGGNLRSEPRIAANTVIGQICPGDQMALLEQREQWVRVRLVNPTADCVPTRVSPGTEGWVSSNLVVPTYPLPEEYPAMPEGLVAAVVNRVVNGDSLEVAISGVTSRIRFIGVEAPVAPGAASPAECFGQEAQTHARELIAGEFVLLETDESQGEQDRFGQLLCYVWLPDGTMVNYEMVRQGYAFEDTLNVPYRYQEVFQQAEQTASAQQLGLWSPETCNGERTLVEEKPEATLPPAPPLPTPSPAPLSPTPLPPTPTPLPIATFTAVPTITPIPTSTPPGNVLTPTPTPGESAEETPTDAVPGEEPTLPPPPAPAPPTLPPERDFDTNGDGEVTCEDFTTCEEAIRALNAGYTRLDYDNDGIPCESLCGGR